MGSLVAIETATVPQSIKHLPVLRSGTGSLARNQRVFSQMPALTRRSSRDPDAIVLFGKLCPNFNSVEVRSFILGAHQIHDIPRHATITGAPSKYRSFTSNLVVVDLDDIDDRL